MTTSAPAAPSLARHLADFYLSVCRGNREQAVLALQERVIRDPVDRDYRLALDLLTRRNDA